MDSLIEWKDDQSTIIILINSFDRIQKINCITWDTPHTKWALPDTVYTVSITTLTANNLKLFTIIFGDVIAEVIPKSYKWIIFYGMNIEKHREI